MAEILSPAGSPEHAQAAVKSGADAIYLGLKKFSARGSAANFDEEQLREIVSFCHRRGVKVHVALNTMMFDSELSECADALRLLCEIGVDAVISQDLAVAAIAEKCCPALELHASTQMTLHTLCGCDFAERLGFKRTVLSRELPLENIKKIAAKSPTETEIFIHGALCMSVSGQCLMSAAVGGRSANRGMCAQPCRLPCSVKKGREDYALSLKDMSYLDSLPELEACGADSMKIEGRMKRPEYAALSADCAQKALRGEKYDRELLSDVFSRGGFTDGYLHRKTGAQMFGRRTKEDAKNASAAYPKIHELYRRDCKRGRLNFFAEVKSGQPLKISAIDENGLYAEVLGEIPERAENRECDEEFLRRQLGKLGDTFYTLESLSCEIDRGLAAASSELNRARREIVEKISELREEYFSRKTEFDIGAPDLDFEKRERTGSFEIRINASRAEQLSRISAEDFSIGFLPLNASEVKKALEFLPAEKIGIAMPRFTFNENHDIAGLKELAALGIKHILCTNFAHIEIAARLGLTAHAAAGLNTANSLALKKLAELGAADATVSCEMKAAQINALSAGVKIGAVAYGRLALMLTANCPIRAQAGCKNCTGAIYDRTGREFPVKCSKSCGYVEILNSDVLCISDKLQDFGGADFLQLEFYDESPKRAAEVVRLFKSGEGYSFGGAVTRGLYYRGLKN
jgi:putative protease